MGSVRNVSSKLKIEKTKKDSKRKNKTRNRECETTNQYKAEGGSQILRRLNL